MRNVRILRAHSIARSCLQTPPTSVATTWILSRWTSTCVYDLNEKTIDADMLLRFRDSQSGSRCLTTASRIKRRRRLRITAVYALLETA